MLSIPTSLVPVFELRLFREVVYGNRFSKRDLKDGTSVISIVTQISSPHNKQGGFCKDFQHDSGIHMEVLHDSAGAWTPQTGGSQ
jgi:hypothetical protein